VSRPAPRRDLLVGQFELTWSLLDYHLELLVPDDLLWEPAPICWTMRPGPDGRWVPDWEDAEPDPIPVPTIGWITWHLGWWWSVTLDHVDGRPPRERTEIAWPGERDDTVAWLRGLRDEWATALGRLTDADLDAPAAFPWPADAQRTVADMAAWVNVELMKNTAEIGQLRLLRAVRD
jgi:hypothetical protein